MVLQHSVLWLLKRLVFDFSFIRQFLARRIGNESNHGATKACK